MYNFFMINKGSFSVQFKILICLFSYFLFPRSNFVCDSKNMLLGLPDGQLQLFSWNGEVHVNAISMLLLSSCTLISYISYYQHSTCTLRP